MGHSKSKSSDCTPVSLGITEREFHGLVKSGRELKAIYVSSRRRLNPNYKPDTQTWPEDFWTITARNLMTRRVDFLQFVELLFRRFHPVVPQPNVLRSESNFRYYEEYYGSGKALEAANAFIASQNTVVRAELERGRSILDLVNDESLRLNPVLLLCLASQMREPDVVSELLHTARNYLHHYPHWRESILKPFLPPEL